jgi:hypothetical protein
MNVTRMFQTGVALENLGAAVQGDAGFRETCEWQFPSFFLVPITIYSEPPPLRNAACRQNSCSHS